MTKFAIAFLYILFSISAICQDNLQKFIDNKCKYKVAGSGEAKGIKMQLNIPCAWDSVQEDIPHIVRSFMFKVKEDSYLVASLIIVESGYTPSQKELDTLNMDVFFEAPSWGKLLSIRKVNIDALKWTEAHTYIRMSAPEGEKYQYMLSYLLYYKSKVIVISYKTMSFISKESSLSLFNEYERIFKTLAMGTILYNHLK